MNRLTSIKINQILLKNMNRSFSLIKHSGATQKNFSTKEILTKFGIFSSTAVRRSKPETFVGGLQRVLKFAPNNFNFFFFTWSIFCRVATGLLCLLLL